MHQGNRDRSCGGWYKQVSIDGPNISIKAMADKKNFLDLAHRDRGFGARSSQALLQAVLTPECQRTPRSREKEPCRQVMFLEIGPGQRKR